jgi:ribosome-associated protein
MDDFLARIAKPLPGRAFRIRVTDAGEAAEHAACRVSPHPARGGESSALTKAAKPAMAAFCSERTRSTPLNRELAPQAQEAAISASTDDARQGTLEDLIMSRLDDDKAQEIVLIDLKGKSPMADSMIVASGRSHRHVGALADHVLRALKDNGYGRARVEGLPHCDWVLIDAGDLVVHLFRPEVRSFYNIEKIWSVDSSHIKQAN